ncbi:MAG TPA: hypothetical protein VMU15_05895 [Anaeromyxobacter sp.]|nr:hypothetical protein [Anaeromyxobacter sp.]
MPTADPLDPDQLLALLRDPHVESQEIAARAGVPREEAGRATRLLMAFPKAKPEEVASLPAPLAAALARAALSASRGDLLAALAAHASKEVAKEAKRCLHLLRTRGVEVPESPRPAPPAPASQPAEPPPPAFASALDGHGERAAWLPRPVPGRGFELGQAILSDERGLLSLQVVPMGRKEWRTFARDIVVRGAALGVTEVPRTVVHAWIAAARATNEHTGQRVPDGADLWLQQLGPAEAAPAPGAGLPPGPAEEERAAVAASGSLHDLPLFRSWLAEEDFLRKVAARLDEVQVSPLYIDERQRGAQLDRVVADAVEEYLDPTRRARLAGRLLAVADHLDALGDRQSARTAAAAARALAAGQPGAAVPFARLLVERAFSRRPASGAEAPAAPAPDSPLIVAPR